MRSTLFTSFAIAALLSATPVFAALSIATPQLTQCGTTTLKFSGGVGTYGIYVVPTEEPCADSLVDIPEQSGTSYNWKCTLPAGAKVQFLVEDDDSNEAWSGDIVVGSSNDASCVSAAAEKQIDLVQSGNTTTSATPTSGVAQPDGAANAANDPNPSSSSTPNGASARISVSLGALVAAIALTLTQI